MRADDVRPRWLQPSAVERKHVRLRRRAMTRQATKGAPELRLGRSLSRGSRVTAVKQCCGVRARAQAQPPNPRDPNGRGRARLSRVRANPSSGTTPQPVRGAEHPDRGLRPPGGRRLQRQARSQSKRETNAAVTIPTNPFPSAMSVSSRQQRGSIWRGPAMTRSAVTADGYAANGRAARRGCGSPNARCSPRRWAGLRARSRPGPRTPLA